MEGGRDRRERIRGNVGRKDTGGSKIEWGRGR